MIPNACMYLSKGPAVLNNTNSRTICLVSIPPDNIPRSISPRTISPRSISPRTIFPRSISPRTISPRTISPRTISPRSISPRTISPRSISPRTISPGQVECMSFFKNELFVTTGDIVHWGYCPGGIGGVIIIVQTTFF